MIAPADYWWVAFVAVAAGWIPFVLYREKKRREACETYCLTRGFSFASKRPEAEQAYADIGALFKRGFGRWGYTIAGRWNSSSFTAFEYQYGSGKSTRFFRVMLWESADTALPKFSLAPEGFLARIGEKLGMQDIDFAEDPGFSQAYQLRGPDEPAIRSLFTARIRGFFAANTGHHVAGGGGHLFWWQDGRLPAVDELDAFLAEGDGIRRVFLET